MIAGIFNPREIFSSSELTEHNFLTVVNDVSYPDSIPESHGERTIDLATRVLTHARQEFGHHEGIRRSMQDWQDDAHGTEADPGYWREKVFSLTPDERNFGRLKGEQEERLQKAKTIIAWAKAEFGEETIDELRDKQLRDARLEWEDEFEAANKRLEYRRFENSPPDEYNNWQQFETEVDCVEIAYRASVHGTVCIAAIYNDGDGLIAEEFTREQWVEADGNPQDIRSFNRPVLSSDDRSIWGDLKHHFEMFSKAEPVSNPVQSSSA